MPGLLFIFSRISCLEKCILLLEMDSPFQGAGGPPHQTAYPGSQGLIMPPNAAMMPPEQEGSAEMDTSQGMSQPGSSGLAPAEKVYSNTVICRMGQETVQDILLKANEVFQFLKNIQVCAFKHYLYRYQYIKCTYS